MFRREAIEILNNIITGRVAPIGSGHTFALKLRHRSPRVEAKLAISRSPAYPTDPDCSMSVVSKPCSNSATAAARPADPAPTTIASWVSTMVSYVSLSDTAMTSSCPRGVRRSAAALRAE